MSVVGMFARFPKPGTTKTRLAAAIGDHAAADLYACFVRDLVQRASGLTDELWIAFTPCTLESRSWFETLTAASSGADCRLLAQPEGSLGERISWFFRQVAEQGRGPAVLLGTDSPDVPSGRITLALQMLDDAEADLVTVPAADGGYVLVGLAGTPHTLFDSVRWSSPFTLLDTIEAAGLAGLRSVTLPTWYDVDYCENLGTLWALQKQSGLTEAARCPQTARYLERLLPEIEGRLDDERKAIHR